MCCCRLSYAERRGLKEASQGRTTVPCCCSAKREGDEMEEGWKGDEVGTEGQEGDKGRGGGGGGRWKSESWGSVCHCADRWGSWKLSSSVEQRQEARKAKDQPAGQWERVWSTNQNWRNKNKHSISPHMRQRAVKQWKPFSSETVAAV